MKPKRNEAFHGCPMLRVAARGREEGEEGITPPFLISALDADGWAVSRPSRFIIEERASGTHWIGGWCGLQSWSGLCEEGNKTLVSVGYRTSAV
jgi:hypothetical protein